MTRPDFRVPDYLDHIRQAIGRIPNYTGGLTEKALQEQPLVQDAVIRNLEIIGEAAGNIDRRHPDLAVAHPEIPWREIYLMRNRVSHGYFAVDLEVVWETVRRDLPEPERQIAVLSSPP